MKIVKKPITETEEITVFEVGDKVKVLSPPIGYGSAFDKGDLSGILEVISIAEDGDFDVRDNTGTDIYFYHSEMSKCELVPKRVFEAGDKVRVIKAPALFDKDFANGIFEGIQTIQKINSSGGMEVTAPKHEDGYVYLYKSEIEDCLEYVEPSELFPELKMEVRDDGAILIKENGEDMLTISKVSCELQLYIFDTENYEVSFKRTGTHAKGVYSLTRK
jgi:hypothetical protein